MAALQFVDVPGYSALLIRRSYPELIRSGGLIDVAHRWLGSSAATYSVQDRRWRFPSGAVLQFGHMEHEETKRDYDGSEWQFIGFDELTEFTESQYRYMFSRFTRPVDGPLADVPLRMRSGCVDEGDVLTDEGWRPIQEIAAGDHVYGVDAEGRLAPRLVASTHRAWSEDGLLRVRKNNLHMSMTRDHRVVFRRFGSPRYEIAAWDEHEGRSISVARAPEEYVAPGKLDAPFGLEPDTYLAFLGLFLAEGSTATPRRGNYKTIITQCDLEKQGHVHDLLARLPWRYCLSKNGDFQITNKALWEHLRPFGKAHEKHVPRGVLRDASAAQLRVLLAWLAFGDGHWRQRALTYVTVSPRLADDVAEIGVKLGYKVKQTRRRLASSAHRDRLTVYLVASREPVTKVDKADRNDVVVEPYRGWVYCLKIPGVENFVVRQKGTVWISGNTNPGGLGHDWCKARFIDGAEPGAVFIPARLEDNPHVDQQAYDAGLRKMTEAEYRQKRHGDWIKPEGGQMRRDTFTVIDEAPRSPAAIRVWDLAASAPKPGRDPDYTVGALVDLDSQGRLIIHDIRRLRAQPADVEAAVRKEAELDGPAVPVWIEEEGGASGKSLVDQYQRRVLGTETEQRYRVQGYRPAGDKQVRANPFIAMVQRGNVVLVRGNWNGAFLDECEGFPEGSHDDQVDAVSAGLTLLRPRGPTRISSPAQVRIPQPIRR